MKKLLSILGVIAVLVVGGLLAARHFALGYLTPDFVAHYIESEWNCRAEIGSLDIKLGANAAVELTDVALGPRDEYANARTPLADRPKMELANIRIETVRIDVKPGDLLKRRLNIDHLLIDKATISTDMTPEGNATIDRLFDSAPAPGTGGESLTLTGAGDASAAGDDAGGAVEEGANEAKEDDEEFAASDLKVSTQAALVELRDSSVTVSIIKSGARVVLDDLQIVIKDIDIDPNDLVGHNSANFSLGGTVAIESSEGGARLVDLRVSGNGRVAPFNNQTGLVEPAWGAELTFHEGSKVDAFPLVEKLQAKLADIDTGGVDLSDLNLRGELKADTSSRLAFRQGRFILDQPLDFELPDTRFTFQPGSWADTGTNEHEINGVVTASEELTAKIVAKVDEYLEKKLGGLVSADLRKQVLGLALKDGRIAIEFVSNGDLSKPKVDVVTPFGTIGDLKETFDGLKDALKGLFK